MFFEKEKGKRNSFQVYPPFHAQVEKESLYWREKESLLKSELVDVLQRSSAVADSRRSDLEVEIERYTKEKDLIEVKLDEASREPGTERTFIALK